MRLARVSNGHRLKQKVMLRLMGVFIRGGPLDVVRAVFYRPEFWGGPFSAWLQRLLRGPSQWSVSERELFAAFTSRLNQCVF